MVRYRNLRCDDDERRAELERHPTLHGIDYIEVATAPEAENQRVLKVYFLKKTPPADKDSLTLLLNALDGAVDKVAINGGVRVPSIKVIAVKKAGDQLEVRVNEPGDFSTYTLTIESTALDQVYAECTFSFKAGCPSHFDCQTQQVCPPEPRREPLIDYMAKDYASFRQALIDLIPTLTPAWQERHEADLGIALVELLAYVGDQLSYYQDSVANEAYLETARQRISVRRHARLIDYRMHDGASARAFVQINVGSAGVIPASTPVLTHLSQAPGSVPPDTVIAPEQHDLAVKKAGAVFETMEAAHVHPDLNTITLYAWGNRQCCLPHGATTVDLQNDLTTHLKPGDFLLFEEVKGPATGLPADADPRHRQIVRLATVDKIHDTLKNLDLTRVSWNIADQLVFPLCISAKLTAGAHKAKYEPQISVARGNLVLADHGRTVEEWYPGDPKADPSIPGIQLGVRAYRFRLKEGPLSFRIPVPQSLTSASELFQLGSDQLRQAVAQVLQIETTPQSGIWLVQPDLLNSDRFASHFVAETDNEGRAVIRFGYQGFGMAPPDGSYFKVSYRVGVGTTGNVGAEALAHLIKPATATNWPSISGVRNPLSAWGGVEPESIAQVRQLAPAACHAEQCRAVTEADYARAAEKHPAVAKAVATFRWTGSWHTVFVTIDPLGANKLSDQLKQQVKDWLTRYTLAGYDLVITGPDYVPLEIALDICVARDHFRGDVEQAVLLALSNRTLPDRSQGFFHPDNFTFGQPLYLSRLYVAVEAVPGVDSALVTKFQRFGKAANNELENAAIPMARLEVLRLDNDPNFPENGRLELKMLGGT